MHRDNRARAEIRRLRNEIRDIQETMATQTDLDTAIAGVKQDVASFGNTLSRLTTQIQQKSAVGLDFSSEVASLHDLSSTMQGYNKSAQGLIDSGTDSSSNSDTSGSTGTATTSSNTPAATSTPTPAPAQNQTPVPAEASVPVAASITLTPTAATVAPGQSQQFGASVDDATGAPLATQPTVSYSVAEGTIDATGLYTAPATAPASGTDTVTATVGEVTEEATVTIPAPAPSGS